MVRCPKVRSVEQIIFFLLKDDFSKYSFVYFLKEKSDVLEALQKFYVDARADNCKLEFIKFRTDCGKEFCNEGVKRLLLSKGIKHEHSTPKAPEQNGYIERQNRTVVESAKSMLHARKLPLYVWAEATATAEYVKNRTASNSLSGKTPYKLWYDEKPSVKHLKVFGSTCYVHIPKDRRSKWEMNSTKMLMIGYSDGNKAYKVFDPITRRCYIRRDVIFDERCCSSDTIIIEKVAQADEEFERDDSDKGDGSKEKSPRRNPRVPIARDPYELR